MRQRAAVRRAYEASARAYDERWAEYTRRSLALLRPILTARPLGALLDVGCGTGSLLPALHGWGARLERYVGADLSPAMLSAAREKDTPHLPPDALAFAAADAGHLPFRDASFDTVVTASSFHHWPDSRAGLAEVRRVLRPGGRLALVDWSGESAGIRLVQAWLTVTGRAHGRALTRRELARRLDAAGLPVRRVARGSAGWPWGLLAVEAG